MHTGRNDAALRARTRKAARQATGTSDKDAGFDITPDFERFNQADDVFSRSRTDGELRDEKADAFYSTYRRPLANWRAAKGFRQLDYAFRNATWHVADVFAEMYEDDDRRDGFLDPLSMLRDGAEATVDCGTPSQAATLIKHAASTAGADLVGVAEYDERWTYTQRFSSGTGAGKPNPLPAAVDNVIVIGQAMDERLIDTAPSALSGAATGMGYSQDAVVLLTVAQFIRNLGYTAVPSMNDTALAIPYAIKAGLGEYGKHGLVITPEFGTSVRFGKIFTDMPLAHDTPISFGVQEMCNICNACSKACPSRAIPNGAPSTDRHNKSNIMGIRKWSIDGEKCFSYWSKINSDCSVCVRVCPYTRDYTQRRNRAWLRLADSPLRKFALDLDRRFGGRQASASRRLVAAVSGTVTSIYISPARKIPMKQVQTVQAESGKGLVGDRYHGSKHRHVSVQSVQDLAEAELAHTGPIDEALTRRNITVSGFEIPTTPGERVTIGGVLLEVVRIAAPCKLLDDDIGPGAKTALRRRAGTIFRLLGSGPISVGDPIASIEHDPTPVQGTTT